MEARWKLWGLKSEEQGDHMVFAGTGKTENLLKWSWQEIRPNKNRAPSFLPPPKHFSHKSWELNLSSLSSVLETRGVCSVCAGLGPLCATNSKHSVHLSSLRLSPRVPQSSLPPKHHPHPAASMAGTGGMVRPDIRSKQCLMSALHLLNWGQAGRCLRVYHPSWHGNISIYIIYEVWHNTYLSVSPSFYLFSLSNLLQLSTFHYLYQSSIAPYYLISSCLSLILFTLIFL